ncbi:hypothetical protein HGO38_23315 [Rhizobium sp. CG5]|uniref:hypothetical protein n=1 Tax=Rhizobium sp. CG5 TaxID=2726076 RepID=UPI002033B3C0|nr:hypothetical protein [Rhizobium sp. CG5]MCM2476396.1 hypothetical protein [Rhizobium sp. CG5]
MILPQRGAKAAFDRGAPMSDRSKTEVLCRPTIWFLGSMTQSPSPIRPWQRRFTHAGH